MNTPERHSGSWVRRIGMGVIAVYGLLVWLMLLLHVLGRQAVLVAQINVALTLFLLPALLLFPLCELRRHWRFLLVYSGTSNPQYEYWYPGQENAPCIFKMLHSCRRD